MNPSRLARLSASAALVISMALVVTAVAARGKPARGEVEAVIAADGQPRSCTLLSSSGDPALDQAAVKRCQGMNFPMPTGSYQPAQEKMTVTLPVRPTPNK